MPLAALTDEAEAALPDVVRRIEQRLSTEATPDTADQLRAATGILLSLKYTEDFLENLYRGLTSMELEDTAFGRMIMRRGERRAVRQTIVRQGTKKFGPPDEATLAALNEIKDVERLEQLSERLLDVSSWQELLAAPN